MPHHRRWDYAEVSGENYCMRAIFALGLLIILAACSGDPKSYGITGPGAQPVRTAAAKHKSPTY
jgi:hypothetical protein